MADLRRLATPVCSGSRATRKATSSRVKTLVNEEKENHGSPSLRSPKNVRSTGRASCSSSSVRQRACTVVQGGASVTPDSRRKSHMPSVRQRMVPSSSTGCTRDNQPDTDLQSASPQTVAVSVYVRVRPPDTRSVCDVTDVYSDCCVTGDRKTIVIAGDALASHSFSFDRVLWSDGCDESSLAASQSEVYETVASPLLDSALNGFNVCLLAYGQTGSGKTHSMMGRGVGDLAGVVPRFCRQLFDKVTAASSETDTELTISVQLSYYEIYNERIRDLLIDDGDSLRVREHPVLGPHVAGLSCPVVENLPAAMELIESGNRRRATASTAMNNKSSRSHSVLTLAVIRTQAESMYGETVKSQQTSLINLVDLAGSERAAQAETSGLRHKEGVRINMSLLTLGKVITALTDGNSAHVPYRESNLTWLLKESLGGNSRTAMLATVSSSQRHVEESLATLRYACLAKQVVNSVRANEDPYARVIGQLREEVERLRAEQLKLSRPELVADDQQLSVMMSPHSADSPNATKSRRIIAQLCRKLQQRDGVLQCRDRELHEARQRLAAGSGCRTLTAAAVPFPGSVSVPCLVLLLPDPTLSETVAYPLVDGVNSVGSGPADTIRLHALTVSSKHCVLECCNGRVQLVERTGDGNRENASGVCPSASVFVNGSCMAMDGGTRQLQHGDRLVLAAEVFLRLHLPARATLGLASFDDARAELQRSFKARAAEQEKRLKLRVKKELMDELNHEQSVDCRLALHADKLQLETQIRSLTDTLHELQKQKSALESRPSRLAEAETCTPSSPSRSDFLQKLEEMFECPDSDPSTTSEDRSGQVDAATLQLMDECNALLRRLGSTVTLDPDYEVSSSGRLCAVAKVVDPETSRYTIWSPSRLQHKVGLLHSLCEEQNCDGCGSRDLSVVLESTVGWRSSTQRRRSQQISRLDAGSPFRNAASSPTAREIMCVSAARLVSAAPWCDSAECGAIGALLGHLTRLTHCLTDVQQLEGGYDQYVEDLTVHFYRLVTDYSVWRHCGRLPGEEECLSHLDSTISGVQHSLTRILQSVAAVERHSVEDGVEECCSLLSRVCRLLGAVQHGESYLQNLEGVDSTIMCYFMHGVRMSLDHALSEAITACEDTEAQLAGMTDDSVSESSISTGLIFSPTHELVACVRCFLQRIRLLQKECCEKLGEQQIDCQSELDCGEVLPHLAVGVADCDRLKYCIEALSDHLASHHRGESLAGEQVRQWLGHVFAALVRLTERSHVTCGVGGSPGEGERRRDSALRRCFGESVAACRQLLDRLPPPAPDTAGESWSDLLEITLVDEGHADVSPLLSTHSVDEQMSACSWHRISQRVQHAVQLLKLTPSRSNIRPSWRQATPNADKRVHFQRKD